MWTSENQQQHGSQQQQCTNNSVDTVPVTVTVMTSPTTETSAITGIPFFGHFFAENCFRVSLFAIFSTDSKSASNSAFFLKRLKKTKTYFVNVS
jgi:hypothetical protein